jgi:predicted O-methyltransferase YrrM
MIAKHPILTAQLMLCAIKVAQELRMNVAAAEILMEYEARHLAERRIRLGLSAEEFHQSRDKFLVPIGEDTGKLLSELIRGTKARNILELGTAYGYSTLWLADAARDVGGKVITCEIVPAKSAFARDTATRAGLADCVEFVVGDASVLLDNRTDTFDFVLLDIWKDAYRSIFESVYPKLNPGALVAADNMLLPTTYKEAALEYRAHVRAKPGMSSVLLNVGSGIELSRYDPPNAPS